jgi:glycosyltransferase involved in cell wall biosynthesis
VAVLMNHPYLVYRDPGLEKHLTLREKLIVRYGRNLCQRLLPQVPVIVHTEVVREHLVGLYGLDPHKVMVVPGACPFPLNGDGSFDAERREPSGPFTFLCISRYMPHKNFEILVDVINCLPAYTSKPARCMINISADQHPGARRLLRRIERENLAQQIVNLGWIPTREGLAQVYRSADAYIFPSLMETFSFTYLEAMCFGLPILTSDRDFARDRCQDAAVYFDPLDPESVAKCMARILEDGALRNQLVSRAKFLLEKVPSWEKVAAQFVAVLEGVSGGAALSTCNGTLDA